jgi:2-amino-4-hydroxy-6-hydroxymethyldihydropteridine diphosphokinase
METVIIAAGSNLGNRLEYIRKAGTFLEQLSKGAVTKSSVWESEPVGGAKYPFYNSVAAITTDLEPAALLTKLKEFEQECGREAVPERWGPRILDLDIILYGNLVIDSETLIIPHPEYHQRRFVLLPMSEIDDGLTNPVSRKSVKELIPEAPDIDIHKSNFSW